MLLSFPCSSPFDCSQDGICTICCLEKTISRLPNPSFEATTPNLCSWCTQNFKHYSQLCTDCHSIYCTARPDDLCRYCNQSHRLSLWISTLDPRQVIYLLLSASHRSRPSHLCSTHPSPRSVSRD